MLLLFFLYKEQNFTILNPPKGIVLFNPNLQCFVKGH